MGIALRALKTFTGRPGESKRTDNLVEMGDDFMVENKRRADYLENKGFAAPLIRPRAKAEPAAQNKMDAPPQNKAADAGPLPLTGGATGEASGASSLSAPDRVQGRRESRRQRGERE